MADLGSKTQTVHFVHGPLDGKVMKVRYNEDMIEKLRVFYKGHIAEYRRGEMEIDEIPRDVLYCSKVIHTVE